MNLTWRLAFLAISTFGVVACRRKPVADSSDAVVGFDAGVGLHAVDAGDARRRAGSRAAISGHALSLRAALSEGGADEARPEAGADAATSVRSEGVRQPESLRKIVAQAGKPLKGSDRSIVCAGRKPCRLITSLPAGSDAQGLSLEVVEISLWSEERSAAKPQNDRPPASDCEPFEHWLLVRDGKGVRRAELLLEICNDGYGAAGVGEDEVSVEPNRFIHARNGGSNWRWSESVVESLSPRRFLEQSSTGEWVLGPNVVHDHWSWEKFYGWHVAFSPPCLPDGAVPESEDAHPLENTEPIHLAGYAYYDIPIVTVEPAFANGGWRTTSIGGCGLLVDGAEGHGFVIHGDHAGPTDSSMRVVGSSDGAFYLEIEDDVFTGPTAKWLYDDHVELWVAHIDPIDYMQHCEPPRPEKPTQWAIRLSDGQVFAGYGNPDGSAVKVEMARAQSAQGVRRLKIVPPPGLITFVYSDGDDGRTQHALLATSHLVFGNALSLGRGRGIFEQDAVCRVDKGKLEPRLR